MGRRLSVAQEFGVELLQRQDNIAHNRTQVDSLRMALLASGRKTVEELFPEYFGREDEDAATDDDYFRGDVALDFSGVTFEMPTPEELAMFGEIANVDVGVSSESLQEWL